MGSAPHNKPIAVVFVHGIFGDKATWVNQQSSFPQLLAADPEFNRQVDVFTFEYYSPMWGKASASLPQLAGQLDGAVDQVFKDHQRVIFLAHSMGGIVVRQFLDVHRDRLAKVPMLFFFATPTDGAELTKVATKLSKEPQLRGMLPLEGNDFLQSLQDHWVHWDAAMHTPAYCDYEILGLYGIVRVVSQSSATHLCNQGFDGITADHLGIVKPKDRQDLSYVRFVQAVRESSKLHGPMVTAVGTDLVKVGDLIWQQHDNGVDKTFREAVQLCTEKRPYNDHAWRLPTIDELGYLVYRDDPAKTYHIKNEFPLTSGALWSSTKTAFEKGDDPCAVGRNNGSNDPGDKFVVGIYYYFHPTPPDEPGSRPTSGSLLRRPG